MAYQLFRPMTTVHGALFDMDGVILDSEGLYTRFWQEAAQALGYPMTRPQAMGMRALNRQEATAKLESYFGKGVDYLAVRDKRIELMDAFVAGKGIAPKPGIRELLEALKAQGHRLYVATSKPEETAIEVLEHFDLARYFDKICGAAMEGGRNSKEAVIEYLLDQVGRDMEKVMVGDTKYDVLGAKAHGIPTIAVSWGYGDLQEIRQAGPVAIVDTPEELLQLLQ